MLDNPHPPATRCKDIAIKVLAPPIATQLTQAGYVKYWQEVFFPSYKAALDNPDARTVVIDTDSDTWELQRLAEFGRLTQVAPLQYPNLNAARKAMIARAYDSGKVVISINRLEEEYETKVVNGKEVQAKSGGVRRQGFRDWKYLWQVQLRHFRDEEGFGTKILMCKSDTSVEGMDLRKEDNNFQSLVQMIYPQVDLKEWGYK
jgi:hypothetical protein